MAPRIWTAIGDSFSTAIGDDQYGWVARSAAQLAAAGLLDELVPLAEPHVVIDTVIDSQINKVEPSRIVSAIAGANDIVRPHCDLERLASRVEELLRRSAELGDVMLTSTCPNLGIPRNRPEGRISDRIRTVNRDVERLAVEHHNIVLLDAFALMGHAALWAEDGIHPSAAGHCLLADAAVEMLSEPLTKARR